eukprot:964170-Ditylum_brightwellii.AAC.1
MEMTVLVQGLCVLGANKSSILGVGVFTDQPQILTNDFFTNLIGSTSNGIKWVKLDANKEG